jgi:hypothetical protein
MAKQRVREIEILNVDLLGPVKWRATLMTQAGSASTMEV